MKFVLAWLTLAAAVVFGLGSLNWRAYRGLAVRGVTCQASVTEITLSHHNTVRYTYLVDGRPYAGQTQTGLPNPPPEQLKIGDKLIAYYDSIHPEISVLGDPNAILHNETLFIALAAIVIPTVLVLSWLPSSSRQRTNSAASHARLPANEAPTHP
jgi:hypothetical protein